MIRTRTLIFFLSLAFPAYGLSPYRYAFDRDVSEPDKILVAQRNAAVPVQMQGSSMISATADNKEKI